MLKTQNKFLKKAFSFCCVSVIVFNLGLNVPTKTRAKTLAEQIKPDSEYGIDFDYTTNSTYAGVLSDYTRKGYKPSDLSEPLVFEQDSNLLFNEESDDITLPFNVQSRGLYSIRITYRPDVSSSGDIIRSLLIDDTPPFDECVNLSFPRLWEDKGKPFVNSLGDEIRPGVQQIDDWQTMSLRDSAGLHDDVLKFYLTEGDHTLTLKPIFGGTYLKAIEIYSPQKTKGYDEVLAGYKANEYKSADSDLNFEAEGEFIAYKNNSTLRMTSDGDPVTSPQKVGKTVMNVLGGTGWQNGGSSVTWKFKVKETGLYKLSFRVKQNYREGLPSYRRIEIDGEVPFKEFEAYKFMYNKKWRTETLSNEKGENFQIYLTAGEEHTLTMTVAQGELYDITTLLKSDSLRLSESILKIIMITGQNPDLNYDYELNKRIPDLLPTFQSVIDNMYTMMDMMVKASKQKPSKYHQMKSMAEQLAAMINSPFSIPRRMDDINTILSTYGEWISQFSQHPLLLDTVYLSPLDAVEENRQSNFFQKCWASIVNFILSFLKDYDNVTSSGTENAQITTTLDVWIGRGKDWGELLKRMADEDFTPKTGVGIRLNILPAGQLNTGSANTLLLSVASGTAPDVAMSIPTKSVGEFTLRNAVYDISSFENFPDIKSRFLDSMFIPMTYKDKVFGIPETTNFSVMFYRKDILSNLGLNLPNSWKELSQKTIPVLSQNNMQFYLPPSEDIYLTLLYQHGGAPYTEDLNFSSLDTTEAYKAFLNYTEFFTMHGVPITANFFNRFRTGESPIGIGYYANYMQFLAAAPELNGKWGIAPIPGVEEESGKINNTHVNIYAESDMIMSQSDNPKEAWKFLDWWTSADVQTQYGNEIESLLGKAARWSSANLEAFKNQPWQREDLLEIEKSYNQVTQPPVVFGGYFTGRHINNAFNRVVVSKQNPRDSLEEAVKDINRELKRRREAAKSND